MSDYQHKQFYIVDYFQQCFQTASLEKQPTEQLLTWLKNDEKNNFPNQESENK